MPKTISHGLTTAQPDNPAYDISANEINQHTESYSGLTAGHVMRASAATAADFAAIQDGDLPSTIARDSEVTSAVAALSTVYQPLDSDLTAIAALSTTAFGRALLALTKLGDLVTGFAADASLTGTEELYVNDGLVDKKATANQVRSFTRASGEQININPAATDLYGLLITSSAGFENNYNALIRVVDQTGAHVFNVDTGGIDMVSPAGQGSIHIALIENDTSARCEVGSRVIELTSLAGATLVSVSEDNALLLAPFAPTNTPTFGVQIYYDDTLGAPSLKLKAKDSNNDPFTATIPINGTVGGSPSFLSVAKWA